VRRYYFFRLLRLTLLALEAVEAILMGAQPEEKNYGDGVRLSRPLRRPRQR